MVLWFFRKAGSLTGRRLVRGLQNVREDIKYHLVIPTPSFGRWGHLSARERIKGLDKVPQEVTIRAKIQVSQFPGLCTLHYYTL